MIDMKVSRGIFRNPKFGIDIIRFLSRLIIIRYKIIAKCAHKPFADGRCQI